MLFNTQSSEIDGDQDKKISVFTFKNYDSFRKHLIVAFDEFKIRSLSKASILKVTGSYNTLKSLSQCSIKRGR